MAKTTADKVLLAIVVVLALVASGYAGYSLSSHRTTGKIAALDKQVKDLKDASAANSNLTFAPLSPFGIQFPFDNDPSGLGFTSIDKDTVAFDSQTLKDLAQRLDPSNTCSGEGTLGTLVRQTNIPINQAGPTLDGQVGHLNGYYYVFFHATKNCSTNSQVIGEQTKEQSSLIAALKGMKLLSPEK